MAGRGRTKLTGSVMGQILEDAAMHFTEVGNVETALNRIDLEFDDPGKSEPPLAREVVRRCHQPRALIAATCSSVVIRSEEHTSELQSLMRITYAVFCLIKKKDNYRKNERKQTHQ